MSFFDLKSQIDVGEAYKRILEEQVMISYMSKSISIFDTDVLCPFDRKLILDILDEIKEEEKKQLEDMSKK